MLNLGSTPYQRHVAQRNILDPFIPGLRWLWLRVLAFSIFIWGASIVAQGQENLLTNPGFEEVGAQNLPAGWSMHADSQQKATLKEEGARAGQRCLAIPAQGSVEQHIDHARAGAYLARCWVKSEAEQRVTFILSNPDRPWAAYNLVEAKVPKDVWTQIEVFCSLDQDGGLTLTVGGTSKDYRNYHGPETEMRSSILIDDCELIRSEPNTANSAIWDGPDVLRKLFSSPTSLWIDKSFLSSSVARNPTFAHTPVFQARHLIGTVEKLDDGALLIYAAPRDDELKRRCMIIPSPAFVPSKFALTNSGGRSGVLIASASGYPSYTVWISTNGLITIEPNKISQFRIDSRMSYGILPSFAGTDIVYAPAKMTNVSKVAIPSTQWFVGLLEKEPIAMDDRIGRIDPVRRHDSMFVAVWDSPSQAVSLGMSREGALRAIDSLTINTEKFGFSFSFVEHPNIWHKEPLREDYLGDYSTIGWERPFEARWMAQFFVSPGGKRLFHDPFNDYSFPIASAKTRMWGVWFEDWNHYPFYFDGPRTVFHFEKSFAPAGDALIYFLEPAAADLYSPCEIVQQALGTENAAALFDFDANGLRKLKYSTPPLFMYDRPVCATTTRLSKIKQEEKPTVGVNLATHLFEFIREIRGRIDQYSSFFAATKDYLEAEKTAHPDVKAYVEELERLVAEAQSKTKKVYDTPLPSVQAKIEGMKKLLEQGKGDGFDCGNLDVRSPAGEQDDLCRRYNRLTLLLMQTAALNCGDSPEKAVIAKHIWDESRAVLRQPTRWEPRRTLYFFEP